MTTVDTVVTTARNYLRDFPKFFQVSFPVVGRTFEISHQNIDKDSLWVAYTPTSASAGASVVSPSSYSLDQRNGILRLNALPPQGATVLIEGYYYEWLLPSDLEFYSKIAIEKHLPALNVPLEALSAVAVNAVAIAAICESLWALMTEFSRDIDVMTSESIHIPASQRFRMVQSLLGQWEAEYTRHATALNIGIDRIEVFALRRTSRTTNRLVPLYKPKEIGDFGPMERLWPFIDPGIVSLEEKEEPLRADVYVDGDPPANITATSGQFLY